MQKTDKIFVAGPETLIGSAILNVLRGRGYRQLVGIGSEAPDLCDASSVDAFFARHNPEYVFLAGGKSGGIQANQNYPAELMLDNLLTICNVARAAYTYRAKKLLYLASSCCYPKESPQPMRVDDLMTGPLEPTNEAYATAKLAGLGVCAAYRRQYGASFISAIPANVFGPGDEFDPEDSHVIAAMIRKMHDAKVAGADYLELWGTGAPEREFIFAEDLADACLFLMDKYDSPAPINIGAPSQRFSIKDLALQIKTAVGYSGEVRFDRNRPDGMARKTLDSVPLTNMGWSPTTELSAALSATYQYFLNVERRNEVSHV